jgi:hypothetical protein
VRTMYCAIALSVLAIGCTDLSAPPKASDQRSSESVVGGDLSGYIPTPAGWYHRSCVHQVDNGAFVEGNGRVHRPDGTSYVLPTCAYPKRMTISASEQVLRAPQAPTSLNPAWVEFALDTLTTGSSWGKITSSTNVPVSPTGSYARRGRLLHVPRPGKSDHDYPARPAVRQQRHVRGIVLDNGLVALRPELYLQHASPHQ